MYTPGIIKIQQFYYDNEKYRFQMQVYNRWHFVRFEEITKI